MFCNNCGKEISNDSLFCTNCGNKVEKNIPPITPPPTTSNNTALDEKKKNKLLLPLIIVGTLLLIAIGVMVVLFVRKSLFNRNDIETDNNKGRNIAIEDDDDELDEMATNDSQLDDNTDDMGLDVSDDQLGDSSNTGDANINFYPIYTYDELPDVLSIDSDTRFSYVDYYPLGDSSVYSFQFNEANATDADFYNACEEYSILLQELNGFTYESDYSDQKYAETGLIANYLTKGDYAISITASVEEPDYFAYVTIYLLADEVDGGNVTGDNITVVFDMPNYNKFLANRDTISFTYGHEVNMDNGIAFYIYDAMGNFTEDGSAVMDVVLDISSYYSDYYFNNGDFFMIPLDVEGNVLSDAVPVALVLDEAGNEVSMPFLLSASSYDKYTFYFPVPNETYSILLYATNVLNDDYSYPAYVMHIGN
ncbi:MAG: zinc ribbon domain-containing protein [Clostridiales bacterium]|nr:zinc ribbon domain-containing protein [Clostridiales bacterium]